MTIEEKAEEYRSDTFGTPFSNDIKMAFIEGAQMQSELALENSPMEVDLIIKK